MEELPDSDAEGRAIHNSILANPILADKLASRDATGIAVYIPIAKKDYAHDIGAAIDAIAVEEISEGQAYYLAGMPIAEDTFGVEMFQQMGVMAPISGFGSVFRTCNISARTRASAPRSPGSKATRSTCTVPDGDGVSDEPMVAG